MGGSGAVSWMFPRKSHFMIKGENASEEKLMDIVIDAGAEDIEVNDGIAEIWGPVQAFVQHFKVIQTLTLLHDEAIATKTGKSFHITKEKAARIIKLVDKFEELDDHSAFIRNLLTFLRKSFDRFN